VRMMARGALWLGLYLGLVALPLAVAAIWPGAMAGRAFATQFGVACGFAGLTILILELALVSEIQAVASIFGQDALLRFHRRMGMAGTGLLIVHATLAMQGSYPFAWLNPFSAESPWAMRWGVIAMAALGLLVGLSVGRRRLRLGYAWWQFTHGLLADAAIAGGLAHIVLFSGFSAERPMLVVLTGYGCAAAGLRIWFKVVRPLGLWARPWELVRNIVENEDTRTLVLRPVGHPGFLFEPGQFAWLNTGRTPLHWDRHPISMSSAASDEAGAEVAFTIKALGDWSGEVVPKLLPGSRVWVDGPHGVFTADREQGPGYVLIGGGSGICPLVSICATLALRGDSRPVLLFYGASRESRMVLGGRLRELEGAKNMRVIPVLEEPPPGWTGERGYVTVEMLRRYLPAQFRRYQYFVCGPEPMMDAVEPMLRELGVPEERIHTERFVLV
jgi:predicted ferric reductase